jgi:ferredoxin-type protein NapF
MAMLANPVDISRRNLLTGRVGAGQSRDIRPPWSIGQEFEARCSRCGDCLEHCAERILVAGDGGYPKVDFSKGRCTFCADCVTACKSQALDRAVGAPWSLKAEVKTGCLSITGISCRSCGDVCHSKAIRFFPRTGGRVHLEIERGFCTGCGACLGVCPVQAIALAAQKPMEGPLGRLEGVA